MSTLGTDLVTEIRPAFAAATSTEHLIQKLPILILFPHNRCNCRCIMCDIWKIRETRQLQLADLEPHLASIRKLGVEWLVLSGGEPLLHEGLGEILQFFRREGIRITLLSTGLLLEDCAALIAHYVDDLILSLDGPPSTHNAIRRIPDAFERLERGVAAVRKLKPQMSIHARSTVQRANHSFLPRIVETARDLGLDSISFLAADTSSEAFNRAQAWNEARQGTVRLEEAEIATLSDAIEALVREHPEDFASRFIQESPEKLRRIVHHFRSQLGLAEAVAPRCNAPWTSSVVESDGTVRPCFFHAPIGHLQDGPLDTILNSERALAFRQQLDVATDPTCRNCVCSLHYKTKQ